MDHFVAAQIDAALRPGRVRAEAEGVRMARGRQGDGNGPGQHRVAGRVAHEREWRHVAAGALDTHIQPGDGGPAPQCHMDGHIPQIVARPIMSYARRGHRGLVGGCTRAAGRAAAQEEQRDGQADTRQAHGGPGKGEGRASENGGYGRPPFRDGCWRAASV